MAGYKQHLLDHHTVHHDLTEDDDKEHGETTQQDEPKVCEHCGEDELNTWVVACTDCEVASCIGCVKSDKCYRCLSHVCDACSSRHHLRCTRQQAPLPCQQGDQEVTNVEAQVEAQNGAPVAPRLSSLDHPDGWWPDEEEPEEIQQAAWAEEPRDFEEQPPAVRRKLTVKPPKPSRHIGPRGSMTMTTSEKRSKRSKKEDWNSISGT